MNEWILIGLMLPITVAMASLPLIAARFIAPKKPSAAKAETYECGVETVGETWVQFKVQYYIYALVFLIFDIETVFLYPWAVAYNALPLYAVIEGVIFIAILGVALLYVLRTRALDWV